VPHLVPNRRRVNRLCHTSAADRRTLLHLADDTRRRGDGHRPAGARRPSSLSTNVPPALSHRPSPAAPQPALLGRVVAKYRSAEPDTAEHAICSEDSDDDLPRHRTRRTHVVTVDHRQLDTASL